MSKLTVFDPWSQFERMGALIDSLSTPSRRSWSGEASQMPIDILETGDALVVRASLPGVRQDQVDVSVENGVLTIRGELRFESQGEDTKVFRREIATGSFVRSIVLPDTVNAQQASATFDHGLVTVTVPKREEAKPVSFKVPLQPAIEANPSNN